MPVHSTSSITYLFGTVCPKYEPPTACPVVNPNCLKYLENQKPRSECLNQNYAPADHACLDIVPALVTDWTKLTLSVDSINIAGTFSPISKHSKFPTQLILIINSYWTQWVRNFILWLGHGRQTPKYAASQLFSSLLHILGYYVCRHRGLSQPGAPLGI